MEKVIWKVSGLVFATSTLVGLMSGLLAAPRSGVRTRGKMQKNHGDIKDRVIHQMHDLKGSVINVAEPRNTYRKNWLS